MKTNKTWTKRPNKVGHFRLSIGHFVLTDTNFAEIRDELSVKWRHWRAKHHWPGLKQNQLGFVQVVR